MMRYHPSKFGRRKISTSVDIVETVAFDHISPYCDLDLENSKPTFSHDIGPWCCITTPCLATKGSAVQKIPCRWTFFEILNYCCDLGSTLSITKQCTWQNNVISSKDNPAYATKPSFTDILKFHCDLDTEHGNLFFPFFTGHSGTW